MDLPKQIFFGQHWNAQVAEFIRYGLLQMKTTAFKHTDILAIRQWGGRYRNRISVYINGDMPNNLPKYFQLGIGQQIQIQVSYDDVGQTQKRAMELPKCWNWQTFDYTWRHCLKIKKERAIYIQQINSNFNLSKEQKHHLIRNWRYKPDYCRKCSKTSHSHTVCYGSENCRHCHSDTQRSYLKSTQCEYVMQTAMATLRFDYFYQKCMNFYKQIPPIPRIDQDFEYNKPRF